MNSADTKGQVIKICGITTQQDAEDAVASGATALGFNFYPKSPRYISLKRAQDIARSLPRSVLKVGVFVNASADELAAAGTSVPLDVLQLHGEVPALVPRLRIWRAIPINQDVNLSGLNDSYEAYLLDTPSSDFGGSGRTFDWSLVAASGSPLRLIVAGGLDASNVAEAIAALHPWGVDACSRLESAAGRKDPVKVKAFVQAASAAFEHLSTGDAPSHARELTS
jgi:phosphoribosylanthranilate isomerase